MYGIVIASIIMSGLSIAFYLAFRYRTAELAYKERMAALEKGIDIKPVVLAARPDLGHRVYLLRGLIWLATGVVLFLVLWILIGLVEMRTPEQDLENRLTRERWLRGLGASEQQMQELSAARKAREEHAPKKEALALVGLVPAAAGVAYLVFFVVEDRRIRRQRQTSGTFTSLPPSSADA